jgi:hypothetical protein
MAYGAYDGPDKADKGKENGSCNRRRCQCAPASWYSHATRAWYCEACAEDIGQSPFNLQDWQTLYQPKLGHPMFETRLMIDNRGGSVPATNVK